MASLIPWGGVGRGAWDPFSVDVLDPFDIGRGWLWDTTSGRGGGGRDDTSAVARTNVDWRETENSHIFTAELPGLKKEEVKVEVEEGSILKISGEKVKEEENRDDTWHRVERGRGKFARRFRLPENVNMDGIRCKMENGVLHVEIPKKQTPPQQSNVRSIDIQ